MHSARDFKTVINKPAKPPLYIDKGLEEEISRRSLIGSVL